MIPFGAMLLTELKFQWRHGFIIAAAVVTIVWALLLNFLPDAQKAFWFGIVTALDVASIGLLFGFGLGMLDRNQRAVLAIRITPVHSWVLAAARIVSLSLLLTVTLFVLGLLVLEWATVLRLSLAIVLNAVFFSTIGVTCARYFVTVNQFIIFFALSGAVWALPILYYSELVSSILWLSLPSSGGTLMLKLGFSELPHSTLLLAIAFQIVWIGLAFFAGERWAPKTLEHRFGGH